MKKRILLIALAITMATVAGAQVKAPATTHAVLGKPKLVLAIVVDQFRYDYLLRFESEYKEGLHKLLTAGAVFTNARYQHYPTYTAVGHSTLLSGALPAVSGIIGNQWYDRKSGKTVKAAEDEATKIVGGTSGPGSSPKNLMVSTIGDELKIADASGQSKVIGMSLKDYSGIMATGRMSNAVYWFDGKAGNFVTSTYYVADLPGWAKEFNETRPADQYRGKKWLNTEMPKTAGPELNNALLNTPFGSELLEQFAEKAIKSEQLGRDDHPDLLVISFSSNDFIGHSNGPDSEQVRDISIATDKVIGKLFTFIDAEIGMSNVMVVFSSDHGVASKPEVNTARKMPGGRIPLNTTRDAVQKTLSEKYGQGDWIAGIPEDSIYLNWDLIKSKKLSYEDVVEEAATAIRILPNVFRAYTRPQLLKGYSMSDQIGNRVMNGYSSSRGADIVVLYDPYYITTPGSSTTHGSTFGYDVHVPVIFMGPWIKPGRYHSSIAVNDVAPTLAEILKVEIPSGAEGRILSEIFTSR
jgi:predicted AlkP superfamily pyrophosphatase or phosphodiesterase